MSTEIAAIEAAYFRDYSFSLIAASSARFILICEGIQEGYMEVVEMVALMKRSSGEQDGVQRCVASAYICFALLIQSSVDGWSVCPRIVRHHCEMQKAIYIHLDFLATMPKWNGDESELNTGTSVTMAGSIVSPFSFAQLALIRCWIGTLLSSLHSWR
jgi:hypothetical protein